MKIFLSSTFKDLVDERKAVEAVIHRIGEKYVGMEYFGSFAALPVDKCIEKVQAADGLVLVLAQRYGYIPDGYDKSMTEIEYRTAVDSGIPVLCYLREKSKAPKKRWEVLLEITRLKEGRYDEGDDPRLSALIQGVMAKHGISRFTSPQDLAWKVATDIAREFHLEEKNIHLDKTALRDGIYQDPIRDSVDELINILELRAQKIRDDLAYFVKYSDVQTFLKEFEVLHKRHLESLREGKMTLAHEYLSKIHQLSWDLTKLEFWDNSSPRVDYDLEEDSLTWATCRIFT